ncbi:hypothetical protein Tco_0211019 [Tanacetum coccineum]
MDVVGGVVVSTFVNPLIADVITFLSDDSRKQVLQKLSDNSGIVRDLLDASILPPPLLVCPLVLPPRCAVVYRPAFRVVTLEALSTRGRVHKIAPKKRTTRASLATTTTTTTPVTNAQLKALINQGVADALAARDVDISINGDDSHNSGTCIRRQAPLACECTYPDFMKCKPLYFNGTEGVVELTQWFERIENVFRISNCTVENQIKFATCTLFGSALTWWNAHVRTVGHDVAYAMTWTNLKKIMTDKYCPKGEIKKLKVEMWNLKVKGADVIKKYVGGLPDIIHGSVMASKPKTMQYAIEFATELMDKKISTLAERQAKNKRKLDNNNQAQQQPPKKQGVAIAYTIRSGERREYARTLPLCNKYKFHHKGQCTVKCANCKRVGHLTQDCKSPATTNNQRNLTCYECGNQGHYRSDCLELKNKNHGNQAGGTRARGMVHDL